MSSPADAGLAWRLRGFETADAEPLCAMDEVCFTPQFQISRRMMRRDLAAQESFTVVAVDDAGARIGFAVAQLTPRASMPPLGYGLTLDVLPNWRGQGLGAALVRWMEEAVRAAGAAGLWLHVHTGNTAAISLYERVGMQRERLEVGFYGRDAAGEMINAWIYCKWFEDGPNEAS